MTLDRDTPTASSNLETWLSWLESVHPKSIDMGLDRLRRVALRLGILKPSKPFVLVGGTNGKGSTVAMLSKIYSKAGYKTGVYTSPHIDAFSERICINEQSVDDQTIINAFDSIEQVRLPDSLTYFEFATLGAMWIFEQSDCDVYLFEVGLGGRLDATNLWDADCAVVTSIALDHQEYLGNDRASIAVEKAAIGRPGRLLVIGDEDPPETLIKYCSDHQISINHAGGLPNSMLPLTSLPGQHQQRNAACACAVIEALQPILPVPQQTAHEALLEVSVRGRFETIQVDEVHVVMDVAHNPAGAKALAEAWRSRFGDQKAQVIFACLMDKDLNGIVSELAPLANQWHCVKLEQARSYPTGQMAVLMQDLLDQSVIDHPSFNKAWEQAYHQAVENQHSILIAGSFHTLALARDLLQNTVS